MAGERLYHVLLWSRDGKDFFREKREDRERFLRLLRKARKSGELHVYAYCLLKDRLMFLCSCPSCSMDKILASVEGVYQNYCQGKYKDKAPVWEHGVYECEWEGLLDLVRYVHRAPVRAEKPKGLRYRWSSYREYLTENDRWVDYRAVLAVYGKKQRSALKRLKRYMRSPGADGPVTMYYIEGSDRQETMDVPKTAPAEDARAEMWEPYESAVVVETGTIAPETRPDKPDAPEKDTDGEGPALPGDIIVLTAEMMGVTPASMRQGGGVAQETAARRVALYLLKEQGRLTNAETGRMLGMAPSTVSRTYNNGALREELTGRIERVRRRLKTDS